MPASADVRRRVMVSSRSTALPRTAVSPLTWSCDQFTPSSSLVIVHSPVGPRPSSVACRCSDEPRGSGDACGSAWRVHRSIHSVTPSAASSGDRSKSAPRASAASARCTVASCRRRRIHHPAGREPRNVHTLASGPTWSTADSSSCTPPSSHSIAASGSSGGLPSVTVRGSSSSWRRSATIWALHRLPRPTCLNSWLSVQPGQAGTGVAGSPARIWAPNALVSSIRADLKSTLRTYLAARLAKCDRQGRPPAQHPGVATAPRTCQRGVGVALEERAKADLALGAGQRGAEAEVPAPGERQVLASILAGDVEAVRVGEHVGIAVGPGEVEDDELAALDGPARHLGVLAGTPGAQLYR